MGLKRTTESCRNCPFVKTCDHKKMEALGYFPEPLIAEVKAPLMAEMAAPILRETENIVIDGNVVKVYKDEIEKELYKQLYYHLGLQIGS